MIGCLTHAIANPFDRLWGFARALKEPLDRPTQTSASRRLCLLPDASIDPIERAPYHIIFAAPCLVRFELDLPVLLRAAALGRDFISAVSRLTSLLKLLTCPPAVRS